MSNVRTMYKSTKQKVINFVIYTYNLYIWRMAIRDLRKLYTANFKNEVVMFATNLKKFVEELAKLEPNTKSKSYYDGEFKKNDVLDFVGASGKKYKLQEVINVNRASKRKTDTGSSSENPK